MRYGMAAGLMFAVLAVAASAQPLQNGGFEDGPAFWTFTGRFAISVAVPAHGGRMTVVLGQRDNSAGPDLNATGSLFQSVRIGTAGAALSFYSLIKTAET